MNSCIQAPILAKGVTFNAEKALWVKGRKLLPGIQIVGSKAAPWLQEMMLPVPFLHCVDTWQSDKQMFMEGRDIAQRASCEKCHFSENVEESVGVLSEVLYDLYKLAFVFHLCQC